MTGPGERDPLERLAEEFLGRVRRGESPTLEEYVARHPQLAAEIREILPAMVEVDRLARRGDTRAAEPAPWPKEDADRPRRFGVYTILRRLGRGGMGVVYEAYHPQRGRSEALKVLKGGLGNVPDLVERFRLEVQAMASLAHDHVVRLFDSGQVGEELYYTMPLLPGASLAEVVREIRATGEFPPGTKALQVLDRCGVAAAAGPASAAPEERYARRVAAALLGVADALAAMHGRDILHRDLKPGNLMLDGGGRVLVSDFGLVRWGDQRITKEGQTPGTPAYMSPEQVLSDGREPDGRVDVYAFGATLFELLTLRLPHEGDSSLETIRLKLSQRVPPARSLNPAIPEDLETLVGRCLERRREDRYPSAAALRDDLARFVRGEPVAMRPVSRMRRALNYVRRHAVPLALAAALAALGAGWHFTRPALLTVASIPAARVLLDGEEIGTTPVAAYRIRPGAHELRIVHPKFCTFVRRFDAARGSTFELDRSLQAIDPADPETLRLVAAASGLQITPVTVERTRSGAEPPLTVLFPRGCVREAPRKARLWVAGVGNAYRAVLERMDGGAAALLAEMPIPLAVGRRDLEIPEEARALLKEGGTFRIRTVRRTEGGAEQEADGAEFSVLAAPDRARVEAEVRRLGLAREAADPLPEFLRIEYLLGQRLFEEAYDRAVALQEGNLRDRREVARAALSVLDAAGLKDRGWWSTWAEIYLRAER